MIIFDIETMPLPDLKIPPLDESPFAPSEFDPASVKTGNIKDIDKIQAKIEEARKAHEQQQAGLAAALEAAKIKHRDEFVSKAALSAVTGRVLVIGYYSPAKNGFVISGGMGTADEERAIASFWEQARKCRVEGRSLIGLNIFEFDLPFLMRRSWILGIDVPDWILDKDRYWNTVFVDLRRRWLCGQYGVNVKSNFDELGTAFATGGKPEGINGGDFARLWVEDNQRAREYLMNDLKQPAMWAERMGVI